MVAYPIDPADLYPSRHVLEDFIRTYRRADGSYRTADLRAMNWPTDPTITNWPVDNVHVITHIHEFAVNVRNAMAILPPTLLRHAMATIEPDGPVDRWPAYLGSWFHKHRIWQGAWTPQEIHRRNHVYNEAHHTRAGRSRKMHCQPCRSQLGSPDHQCYFGDWCRHLHTTKEQWPMPLNFPYPDDSALYPPYANRTLAPYNNAYTRQDALERSRQH